MAIEVQIRKKLGNFELDMEFDSNSRRIGILGASGCGKSMTLKCIAGIETPDQGKIVADGRILYDQGINIRPQKRNVGYLFQNYALFPTMTVRANIAAGLQGTREEKRQIVDKMIAKFQLDGLENRLPGKLSGGQQQRVALARIMAYEPDVILLDEPFSALDGFLKDRLQQELTQMLEDYKGTVILVSHSRDEIYRFSEELVIMNEGKAVCQGKTKNVFENPKRVEAARLTGCKNFSKIQRMDAHTMRALDWGIEFHLKREIPEDITHVGFRAHEFIPVWGERRANCIRLELAGSAELPFEKNFYIKPEQQGEMGQESICWYIQKDKWAILNEQGLPDYLEFPEEQLLFLK
ncbi:MAG: ATP-binding cassette domain-containing protein [Eubacteriales bacterium]|nr:ATP-binding cassette domain-containing protein [Eubacteriales bacterium]